MLRQPIFSCASQTSSLLWAQMEARASPGLCSHTFPASRRYTVRSLLQASVLPCVSNWVQLQYTPEGIEASVHRQTDLPYIPSPSPSHRPALQNDPSQPAAASALPQSCSTALPDLIGRVDFPLLQQCCTDSDNGNPSALFCFCDIDPNTRTEKICFFLPRIPS